jgi:hypothetical protein
MRRIDMREKKTLTSADPDVNWPVAWQHLRGHRDHAHGATNGSHLADGFADPYL